MVERLYRIHFLTLLFLATLQMEAAGTDNAKYSVNYIPFNIATYTAITPENIDGSASAQITGNYDDSRFQTVLSYIINQSDKKRTVCNRLAFTRAKILYKDNLIFVDVSGILKINKECFEVSEKTIQFIEKLLLELR